MVPVTPGAFVFDPGALVKVRSALGLSQAQMAAKLGVPQNTVSRWETGATTPDAHSLAAVYSVAQEKGIMVNMFVEREKQENRQVPALAACYWDMVNLAVQPYVAVRVSEFLTGLMEQRAPGAEAMLLKVFSNPQHESATDTLKAIQGVRWRVWQDEGTWEEEIFDQVLSDIGHAPDRSVVFLVTDDDTLSDLVEEAQRRGARVYVVTPYVLFSGSRGSQLVEAANKRRHIEWPRSWPIVVR